MKHFLISSMLMLCSMGCWAQNSKDSVCVFDGTVTGVPDGSAIYLSVPIPEHPGAYRPDSITCVKGGKFRFEKAMKQGDDCYVAVGRFNMGLNIKLTPGMKTTITGNGADASLWTAENNHPQQKESNVYAKYKKEKLADYLEIESKINAASAKLYTATTDEAKKAVAEEAHHYGSQLKTLYTKYFSTMYEFIKNREFSPSYELETTVLTQLAFYKEKDNEDYMNKCRELFAKFPKDHNSQNAYMIKQWLYPSYKPLEVGDQAKDFTLNDHDGKPHSILETLGKGKYLLLETARKACEGAKVERPKEILKGLASKYADKFDVVTLAISPKQMFDDKEFPREDWLELGLNETSPFEEIMGTYAPKEERFIFISPEGKILGKCNPDKLNDKIKEYFPFVKE